MPAREVDDQLIQHLAPWRQKLLELLRKAKSTPDSPLQESVDGNRADTGAEQVGGN